MDQTRHRLAAGRYAGSDAADWIESWAAERGLDEDTRLAMRLCVEEHITNLVTRGLDAPLDAHVIEIKAERTTDGVRVVVIDDGREFDPTRAAEPGREGSIEEATVGGRGIRLMRRYAAGIAWHRAGERNVTTLTFTTAITPSR